MLYILHEWPRFEAPQTREPPGGPLESFETEGNFTLRRRERAAESGSIILLRIQAEADPHESAPLVVHQLLVGSTPLNLRMIRRIRGQPLPRCSMKPMASMKFASDSFRERGWAPASA